MRSGFSVDTHVHVEDAQDVEALLDLPLTNLPCLDSRPGANSYWQSTEIPFRDVDLLHSFCTLYSVSSLSVLQAAWALVLQCYVGNPSVCFACRVFEGGSGTGKSLLPEVKDGICKAEVQGNAPTIELVSSVRTIKHSSRPHSLGTRSFSSQQSPLMDVPPANTLMLFNEDKRQDWLETERRDCATWDEHSLINPQVVVDISVSKHGFLAILNYRPSTLSVVSAPNVANTYVQAILELLKYPTRNVKDVNIFSPRDLDQLKSWNRPFPQRINTCVHDLILEHARCSPQAPALCSWDGNLTYQELEKMSACLAREFIKAGIRREMLVPVCFRKSLIPIVAMIAIHRAGGAFVPLDPSHPQDRLKAIIDKAKATVVVTSPEVAPLFSEIPVAVVQVSSSMLNSSSLIVEDPLPEISPDQAAFVLFTSGSTGKPKGILQEHASVSTSSLAHGRALNMSADSRVFQYAAFTFDVSMMDIFTTLIYGGCVCIPSEEDRMGSFTTVMNRMRVNWVLFTPSVASLVSPEEVPTLQTLVYGGEAVKQENVSRWVGKVRLFNCYGPAECGACAIGEFTHLDSRPANVGRQFGGELCWVVHPDNHDRLLPIGAAGELVVEGPTLARGYLDDLVKTQTSFIKSPAWPQGAGCDRARRIYKTGDLVRQNSDGTFEFVGRKDLQVKVRGQRVEIGEVEHHMSTYPGIALSMVARPQSGPYAHTLVAVMQLVMPAGIDLKQGDDLNYAPLKHVLAANFEKEKLLDSLRVQLPNYMVPTHVLIVTKLPLSVSGKIDRKIVDAWLVRTSRLAEPVCPDRHLKNLLSSDDPISLEICSKILSLVSEPCSAFFKSLDRTNFPLAAVGLDSIKIIHLVMFVRRRFGVKISLDILMNSKSSVSDIGHEIANTQESGGLTAVKRNIDLMDTLQAYQKKALEDVVGNGTGFLNVMLTGATGFLGSRILRELCRNKKVHRIMVIVRSQNTQEALQRVMQSATQAGWWSKDHTWKLEAWTGDLAKPNLGLNTEHWNRLCGHGSPRDRVNFIIHNGATVNWNASFSALSAINVNSTVDLLKAASESASLCDFVYVSGGQQLRVEADNDLDIAKEVERSNGYAQTKFLSELMVKEYARSIAPCQQRISIIKPGYIIGGQEDGICVEDDFIWRLTSSCVDIESYNAEDADSWLFISDVDHVATVIAGCCSVQNGKLRDRGVNVLKILNGLAVSDFWNMVKQELGRDIRPIPANLWVERLHTDIESRGERHPLWPLLETVEQGQGKLGGKYNAREMVGNDDTRIKSAIRKNVEYLRKTGFLSKPVDGKSIRMDMGETCSVRTPFAVMA